MIRFETMEAARVAQERADRTGRDCVVWATNSRYTCCPWAVDYDNSDNTKSPPLGWCHWSTHWPASR